MYFLNYLGSFEETNENKKKRIYEGGAITFDFHFDKGKIKGVPLFIVSPIYEIIFNILFYYSKNGKFILKDFLNSILYPESNSIKELELIPIEIFRNSHPKNNKRNHNLYYVCLAKIEQKNVMENINIYKQNVIEIIIKKKIIKNPITKKHINFEYNLIETFALVLYFKDINNSSVESYFTKKLKENNETKIYDCYFYDIFNNSNPKSPINNEKIGNIGKEWIKLFCLPLWCESSNDVNYCIPYEINFIGKEIKNAIEILSNIPESVIMKIQADVIYQKDINKQDYENGYKEGFKIGYMEGFQKGYEDWFQLCRAEVIDSFFNIFKSKKIVKNIEILDNISYPFLIKRYGDNPDIQEFAQYLHSKGLLVD